MENTWVGITSTNTTDPNDAHVHLMATSGQPTSFDYDSLALQPMNQTRERTLKRTMIHMTLTTELETHPFSEFPSLV